jgi:diketogulonate reductase-like aldo/keto reductase
MEELQEKEKIRAIGVSNFAVDRVIDLSLFNKITPQVNQIEINPFNQQTEVISALKKEGVTPEAWAPFAEGKNEIFSNPILKKIGDKYNKSIAQVIVRWLIEQDVLVLAKSVNIKRMKENMDVFDFKLSSSDKEDIATLNVSTSQFFSHSDPEMIKWMASRKLDI